MDHQAKARAVRFQHTSRLTTTLNNQHLDTDHETGKAVEAVRPPRTLNAAEAVAVAAVAVAAAVPTTTAPAVVISHATAWSH
jgi:hypothetical protein